jgi:hypothetical protein
MLMQNFKSSADLGITEPQKDALIKTLKLLETGKLRHIPEQEIRPSMDAHGYADLFNMCFTFATSDCGTAACIKGTAEIISGVKFDVFHLTPDLSDLFYAWAPCRSYDPSTSQAATALRSYLTTGEPRWDLAVE